MARTLKRYDIKKLLSDPKIRRWMTVRGVRGLQHMEGIEVSWEEAYRIYDEHEASRKAKRERINQKAVIRRLESPNGRRNSAGSR